jgi:hypothetical protein
VTIFSVETEKFARDVNLLRLPALAAWPLVGCDYSALCFKLAKAQFIYALASVGVALLAPGRWQVWVRVAFGHFFRIGHFLHAVPQHFLAILREGRRINPTDFRSRHGQFFPRI